MAQAPAYNREKNFTLNSGRETDHSALNAELDRASNSINDIRFNLAILQADDGKLRPAVVTADSISADLRVSLVEGVVMDAQTMLDRSLAAADASLASAEEAKASETRAASSASSALASEKAAKDIADHVQARANDIVQTASETARQEAEKALASANRASDSATQAQAVYVQIDGRANDIVQTAASEAQEQAQLAEQSAIEAKLHAEIANQRGIPVGAIVMFSAITPPAGYLKADGAALGRETYPELFAAIGVTFGEGDGETTFNLPDLIDRFAQGSHTPGQKIEAGLPNITGEIRASGKWDNYGSSGAFTQTTYDINAPLGSEFTRGGVTYYFNARNSNPIYGASDTVQPPALTLLPCIKAFDAISNPGLIDITELANEIADKTDKSAAANAVMPSDTYVPLTLQQQGEYTAPADGYFFSTAYASTTTSAFINFTDKNSSWGVMTNILAGSANRVFLPVRKGSVTVLEYAYLLPNTTLGFFYCEGSKP